MDQWKKFTFASDVVVTMAGIGEKTFEMFKQFLWLMFLNQSMMTSVSGALSQDMGSLKGMNPEGWRKPAGSSIDTTVNILNIHCVSLSFFSLLVIIRNKAETPRNRLYKET